MLHMVTDLLDVATIEGGKLTLDRQPADLVELTRCNVKLNGVLSARKAIAIELEAPASIPAIAFDRGKIEQVLNNLISNAVKFSHRGRAVHATVAVRDQGQGIPEADLSKLFKPFNKASVRSTAGEQSTGLGLAIVRNIVEGHGGRIWVESEVGRGSTFSFMAPSAHVSSIGITPRPGPERKLTSSALVRIARAWRVAAIRISSPV